MLFPLVVMQLADTAVPKPFLLLLLLYKFEEEFTPHFRNGGPAAICAQVQGEESI